MYFFENEDTGIWSMKMVLISCINITYR